MYDKDKLNYLVTDVITRLRALQSIMGDKREFKYPFKYRLEDVVKSFEANFEGYYSKDKAEETISIEGKTWDETANMEKDIMYKVAKSLSEIEADIPMRKKFNSLSPNNFLGERGYTVSKYYREIVKWANSIEDVQAERKLTMERMVV